MARRATSLGPKPSLFLFCFVLFLFFCSFPFFASKRQRKTCFPIEKGIFGLFLSLSLCFSLAFFGLPVFQFLFICLSLSCSILYFFLPVFLFCFLFVPSFSLFLSFSFFFALLHERNNIKTLNCNEFFPEIFSLVLVSCLVFSFQSLFLIFVFPDLSYIFVQHQCFWFQKTKLKNTSFWSKRGVATKRFFL